MVSVHQHLLCKGFICEVHMVNLHNAFIVMEKPITHRPAIFFNTTDEEPQHPKRQKTASENYPYSAGLI